MAKNVHVSRTFKLEDGDWVEIEVSEHSRGKVLQIKQGDDTIRMSKALALELIDCLFDAEIL